MRYLRAPNQFQLRLGWLSVIASIVGEGRRSRAEVEQALLRMTIHLPKDPQPAWLEEAGLGPPHGKMSTRAAPDLTRMATAYGIYDPDAQALTDLGQVLFATTRWTPDKSPFCWQGTARFIGTRVLLGTNGDVALELLRRFPRDTALSSGDTILHLEHCLDALALEASLDEDRQGLLAQVERARDPSLRERVHRTLIYPHFEPLRELGYLASSRVGEYTLTDVGQRFIDSVPPGRADDLLRQALASVVLSAEGVPPSTPADGEMLRQTLLDLPGPLMGAHAEAPLEAVVLLTQARLMNEAPGVWIDMALAAELLGRLERRTGGRIGLKAGRSVDEHNITWREQSNLDDARLWHVADDPPPSAEDADADPALYAPNPESEPPPVSVAAVPMAPLKPHALLWLSYVERLLAAPALGDIGGIRRGGPVSWIAALRKLLDVPEDKLEKKRNTSDDKERGKYGRRTIATNHLHRWIERLDGKVDVTAYIECTKLWAPSDGRLTHPDDLRGAFLWADANAERHKIALSQRIREFVDRDGAIHGWGDWDEIREATRGIIDDALHLGLWHAPELLGRLGALSDVDAQGAASKLLDELLCHAAGRTFIFSQELPVAPALLDVLDEVERRSFSLDDATVEMSRSSGDETQDPDSLAVVVKLKARTAEQALSRGAEYAAEAVSRLAFLGTLRMPVGAMGDSASVRPLDAGRLTDEHGEPCRRPAPRDVGMFFDSAEDLGIREARPIEGDLVGVVRELPALAAIDRGVALDGRARLARSLHWLALANAPHQRPAEQLAHGWVAFEHLFADGEQKGHLVAELSAPVVVLCYVRAVAGRLYRDALAALHVAACRDPDEATLQPFVERWLGPTSWERYARRGPGRVVPLSEPIEITDLDGLDGLLARRADLCGLSAALQARVPLVSWQLNRLDELLGQRAKLAAWLEQRRRDAVSFLMGVYEVRNQLVHDANPFGFDDAYRLRDLYERYRVTINPVVAEVLRLVGSDLTMPLKHAWALLRARFRELCAHLGAPAPGRSNPDPVDANTFLACLR